VTVHLVGAGPGDPGLITVRGAELLARADVVVYDRLSVSSLLDLAPASAERIGVGKTPGAPSTPQEDINALLVERGRAGQEVVRLKGGDPFVFARGGEEALALAAAGVPFEVVPGVSSAVAAPAYAGVPVTHRGLSTSFTVVTGHEDPWAATETDWDAVARVGGTIVVLMGAATRADIAARLTKAGMDASTPVVSVQWGSTPKQRTVRTTLGGLGDADVRSPAAIVIGAVAAIDVAWFERRPLFGRRVVVPRAEHQAGALTSRLRGLGADVVELPVIRIEPGDALPAELARYDWIALTSTNAVDALFAHVRDARALAGASVAAVGPGTAAALRARGVEADLLPERSSAEGLVDAFADAGGAGRVLLPLSSMAQPVLRDGLAAKGWEVDVVAAYRTVAAPGLDPSTLASAREADAVAFTSSSTVECFVAAAGLDGVPPVVVCIGPSTAASARSLGVEVAAVADPHTLDGLVDAVVAAIGNRGAA
jgi:uroporphyrinogen III methyltransferase/synthase